MKFNTGNQFIFFLLIFSLNLSFTSCKNQDVKKENPATNDAAANGDNDALFKKYKLDQVKLPAGFTISVYAEVPDV